ncbi:MAG: glycoside hydrolase family 2 TIM barrel-domain containing protein, partial [Bacteroidota bacterium]
MGKFYRTFVLSMIIFFLNAPFNFSFSQANLFDTEKKFFENGQPTPRGIDVGMFADTPLRIKVDLAGDWLFNYNDKEWRDVVVPSAYAFEENVTFQRKFEITADMLDRYNFSLVVYGINYQSEIYINGNFVGRHMGGYTSFTLPIRENVLLVGNENFIKVAVNNYLTVNTTLPLRQQVGGWRNYGGIFRDIYLLATPKLFIGDMYLKSETSSDYKNAKINLETTIENVGFNLTDTEKSKNAFTAFSVEVYEKLTDALVGRSAIIPFDVSIKKQKEISVDVPLANPKLWSPDFPDLYVLKCNIFRVEGKETFPIDEYVLNYGIRDLKFKGSTILFNNTPLQIKGVLWWEDHPFFGSAMTYEAMEKDVAMIKTTGANLIRFLYPPHPYIINLCDRYGILVMQEIPVTQVPAEILEKEFYTDLAQTYAKEMVLRDRNHPSVLAWGIGSDIEI